MLMLLKKKKIISTKVKKKTNKTKTFEVNGFLQKKICYYIYIAHRDNQQDNINIKKNQRLK